LGAELDADMHRLAFDEVDLADHLVATLLEEGAALGPALPGVGDQRAVDEQPRIAGREDAEPVAAGLLRRERALNAGGEQAALDLATGKGRDPEGLRRDHRLAMHRTARGVAAGIEGRGQLAPPQRLPAIVGAALC